MYVFSQQDVYYSKLYAGSPEVRIRQFTSSMFVYIHAIHQIKVTYNTSTNTAFTFCTTGKFDCLSVTCDIILAVL